MKSRSGKPSAIESATVNVSDAASWLRRLRPNSVDLIVTSPPYFLGKEYDLSRSSSDFRQEIKRVIKPMVRSLKDGGSICWQVGNHMSQGKLLPLDATIIGLLQDSPSLLLRNRIIWTFGHGTHSHRRFSGRHETILWYTKGNNYKFNLDAARIPQVYPGKRHYKGPRKGEWSGNPLGKNPGDVWEVGELWDIPNVKANHIEKTDHPCQYPTALARRLITALTDHGDIVADPYLGSGTTAVAALLEGRRFIGCDAEERYISIAQTRIAEFNAGTLKVRDDLPTRAPKPNEAVSRVPPHFRAPKRIQYG